MTATTGNRVVRTNTDGLGRPVKVETLAGAATVSSVDTEYTPCACTPLGKVSRVSQPYAPGATPVYTVSTYDGLGRTTAITAPDGSRTQYAYSGNTTTVTSPAGKWRKSTTNVFGNVTKVTEPNPAGGADQDTLYSYDGMDHLTQVSMTRQNVTQLRTFVYDGNQRLVSATNPENGTVSYTYNPDGTLASKRDAKNQLVVYTYEPQGVGLGRLTGISRYAANGQLDPCQSVAFEYDQLFINGSSNYQLGRLAGVYWGASDGSCPGVPLAFAELYSYQQSGLVYQKQLALTSANGGHPVSGNLDVYYGWDGEGRLAAVQPPQVSVIASRNVWYNYTYDALGRPVKLTSCAPNPWPGFPPGCADIVTASYGPGNERLQMQTTAYTENRTYNNRLQLTRLTASAAGGSNVAPVDLEYRYAAGANDGRLTQRKDWVTGEEVSYSYDGLNRLSGAVTTGPQWGLSISYDGFGNRLGQTVTKGSGPQGSVSYDSGNHMVGAGYSYDANGNLTSVPGGGSYGYDIEKRLAGYVYDAANRRVCANNCAQIYLHGALGERVGTYQANISANQIYFTQLDAEVRFGGRAVQSGNGWVVTDREGSVRANSAGERLEYFPYGEEYTTTAQGRDKFGTYYRDGTGLDYAEQRYYSSTMGRFLTADPYRASGGAADPQSWNRYSYSQNDPVNFTDPQGLMACPAGASAAACAYLEGVPDDDQAAQCFSLAASLGSVAYGFLSNHPVCGPMIGLGGPLLEFAFFLQSIPSAAAAAEQQLCTVSVFGQSAVFENDLFRHTYTEVRFAGERPDQAHFLEGEPVPKNRADTSKLSPHWLNGFNTPGHAQSSFIPTPLWTTLVQISSSTTRSSGWESGGSALV